MDNVYFLHHIRRTSGTVDKQIDIMANFEAAKKAFHQFLGIWAYGKDVNTDLAAVFIADENGNIIEPFDETWISGNSANVFFMHRIRHDKSQEGDAQWTKGIEVKETYDEAKQSYNAYLGAYAYEQTQETENFDLVICRITDGYGAKLMNETWKEPEVQPEPEP